MMLHPYNRRIRRHLLEGALGTLVWAATGTAIGTYHLTEGVRQGNDLLSNIDPSWYFRRPGGGPQYDVTVYCLHNLTGLLGPAKRVDGPLRAGSAATAAVPRPRPSPPTWTIAP
jgi:predicted dehydrogenase